MKKHERKNVDCRRMDRVPKARIKELCGVAKREDERIEEESLVMWRRWRMIRLLKGSI